MNERFIECLNNNKYISLYLYSYVKENNPRLIPYNFNLEKYNEKIINKEYLEDYYYFKNMYQDIDASIVLDDEQIKAIIADEDYSLILAGAGTGKTTTIIGKVKYLVDKKHIDPSKILVLSFTKKTTTELDMRIRIDFNMPDVNVLTFHSLGLRYIREIFWDHICYVVDDNTKNEIFIEYFKNNVFPYKEKVKNIMRVFNSRFTNNKVKFGNFFKDNYDKYKTFDEFFNAYKESKYQEVINSDITIKEKINAIIEADLNADDILTIKGEYVKSKGEAIIANYLFINNIPYKYEKIYKELLDGRKTYKPDFTIEIGGEEIYIEYFGMPDNYNYYKYEKERKINYHSNHHTKFIAIDKAYNRRIVDILKEELIKYGFQLNRMSDKEIYFALLNRNPLSQIFNYKDFLYDCIKWIKASKKRDKFDEVVNNYFYRVDNLDDKDIKTWQYNYIKEFYLYYQNILFGGPIYGFDFDDMIYYASKYLENAKKQKYEYIIIDEYQDISEERYLLTKSIADVNHSKVLAVGDDWQSIYAFSGSKIDYIRDFKDYFPDAKVFKITKTYRNSKNLIKYAGDFIMKNNDQIKKELVSDKEVSNPIKFITYKDGQEYEAIKKIIKIIYQNNPDHSILILARYNQNLEELLNNPDFIDGVGTKVRLLNFNDIDIDLMTIHKSKGLSSDEVIIFGLYDNFPSDNFDSFWFKRLFISKMKEEAIKYAEERRVFYVALTRTKNYVYLMVNEDIRSRSIFALELEGMIKSDKIVNIIE